MASERCATCGKSFEQNDKVVMITKGVWAADSETSGSSSGFSARESFGVLHDACFGRSVESPITAMQEIKKLAKATTKIISLEPKNPGKASTRRRGRPPKVKTVESAPPAVIEAPRRKRGRPPKIATTSNQDATATAKPCRRRRVRGGVEGV